MSKSGYERPDWHRYGCNCYICQRVDEEGSEGEELIHEGSKEEDKVDEDD